MPLLVTAATSLELTAALSPLRGQTLPEQRTIALTWQDRPLLACVTGVGPLNAAMALGLALGEHQTIHAVLNLGLAGAFSLEDFPLGSLVIVTEEIFPEYGVCGDNGLSDGPALGFPQWQPQEGAAVFSRLPLTDANDLPDLTLPDVMPRTTSLTVAGVSAGVNRAAALHTLYGAALENMEGFAVALACARRGILCAEVRCVSNLVGPRASCPHDFPSALRVMETTIPNIFNL